MAELTEVVGTILKDLAQSRVLSDIFSRDVSREYEQDPILVDFPVPRVEIKEAAIQIQFAINAVERKDVDEEKITQDEISNGSIDAGRALFTELVLKHPNSRDLLSVIKEKRISLQDRLVGMIKENTLENRTALRDAMDDKPGVLIRKLQSPIEAFLREDQDLWKALLNGLRVAEIRKVLTVNLRSGVRDLVQRVRTSLDIAEREALIVDVAVTKDELTDVSEIVMSQINLVTEVRNYEWNEVGEEDGVPIRRLRPE
jgi:hypothetical protein